MTGYHEGEIAVQARAGVLAQARRMEPMLVGNYVAGRMGDFLARRNFAVITTRDGDGRLWTSPLFAAPGFLHADGFTLAVRAWPVAGDPLARPRAGAQIGLIAIDFATRRRFRVNGTIADVGESGFEIAIEQAYVNCPKHIRRRSFEVDSTRVGQAPPRRLTALGADQRALIRRADTFFLGTAHPSRGADSSHRGGEPGFLEVADAAGMEGGVLTWPDYPGNTMFNSLGNLAVDPAASILVIDFAGRAALHLSGSAVVEWGGDGDRRVRMTPSDIVEVAHGELVVESIVG